METPKIKADSEKPFWKDESGEVIATTLILMTIVICIFAIISVISFGPGIVKETEKRIESVRTIGATLEEWTVAKPDRKVPFTDEFIPYNSFQILATKNNIVLPDTEDFENLYIKTVSLDKADSSFVLCVSSTDEANRTRNFDYFDEGESLYSFNSSTNKSSKGDNSYC